MFPLFKSRPVRQAAELAYGRVVEAARRAEFFQQGGVPDSVDGRFELISLHAFLYLHRIKREPEAARLAQVFFDTMFADFDRSLREMGTGDLSVGRHIRRMVEGFYGRITAYEAGLAGDDTLLAAAVARNVFGTLREGEIDDAPVAALAAYIRRETARLEREPARGLLAGDVRFGDPSPQLATQAVA